MTEQKMSFEEFQEYLPMRVLNILKWEDCHSFSDIMSKPKREWICIPNFGNKSWHSLKVAMHEAGFKDFGVHPKSNGPIGNVIDTQFIIEMRGALLAIATEIDNAIIKLDKLSQKKNARPNDRHG